MDPVSAIAIGSSALQAGAKIAGGFSEASSLKAKAKAAEMDARNTELQRVQAKGNRVAHINDVIAAVNVVRSGRGLNLDSATGRAIRANRRKRGYEESNIEQLSYLYKRDAQKSRAKNLRSGARMAPLLGLIDAAGDISSMASGFGGLGKTSGPKGGLSVKAHAGASNT